MILGLDISTSSTGWAVLDAEGTLIEQSYIRLDKIKNTMEKATEVADVLAKIKEKYKIESIFIEENLQMFRPGLSSAKTLITLARFNGMVTLLSYKILNIEPEFLNVNSARKLVGLKIDRKDKTRTTKEKVLDWVDKELNQSFNWPKKTLKSGPRKGTEIYENGCYDMADSYVIAMAGYKLLNN
jgi:Holliday junction resolvasome RuvABC endonuclease subunit